MAKCKLIHFLALLLWPLVSQARIQSEYFERNSIPLVMDFGIEFAKQSFGRIDQVVIRNPSNSNEVAPVIGSVNEDYPDIFAQTLRLKILLNPKKKADLDIQSYLPLNGFAQFDTGNTYLPEYVLYRVEKQRPRVMAMGSMNLSSHFRMGLGFDLGFSITSDASIVLMAGAGKFSSQRISATAKPKIIPVAMFDFESFILKIRGENKANLVFNASASANPLLGAQFDITYSSNPALYYEPWILDLSRRFEFTQTTGSEWGVDLGLSYQLWSGYDARAAVINQISGTFSNGLAPDFKAKNIWVPRVTVDKRFWGQRWQLGYEYKESIFKATPTGNGNYLDPPRHTLMLSALFPIMNRWEFGANFMVSQLVSQSVVKSNPTDIGGPFYQASGWVMGGGLNLTVPFEANKI